jgi:hypothetical protein
MWVNYLLNVRLGGVTVMASSVLMFVFAKISIFLGTPPILHIIPSTYLPDIFSSLESVIPPSLRKRK